MFRSKCKVAVTMMILTGMLCSGMTTYAGNASGFGEQNLPYKTSIYRKTTNVGSSDLVLGDVSIYDQILACTYSQELGGTFIQSNPWTTCYEYSSTYLGQYVSMEAYVGQGIYLKTAQRSGVQEIYSVEIESWDYK